MAAAGATLPLPCLASLDHAAAAFSHGSAFPAAHLYPSHLPHSLPTVRVYGRTRGSTCCTCLLSLRRPLGHSVYGSLGKRCCVLMPAVLEREISFMVHTQSDRALRLSCIDSCLHLKIELQIPVLLHLSESNERLAMRA